MTVLGQKGPSGGIVPEKLYAVEWVAIEQSEKDAAKRMLIARIAMMVCALIFLVFGGGESNFWPKNVEEFRQDTVWMKYPLRIK